MAPPTDDPDLWLRRFHPDSEATAPSRVVCFPHAGGAATWFFSLSAALTPAVDVVAVQYPGRQDRRAEPGLETVDEIADGAVRAARTLDDRPLVLFGHSLGASVAFEVARRLQASGTPPRALVVSGRRAPQASHDDGIHRADDAGLLARVRYLGGTDVAVLEDEDIVQMVLPALRTDYRAAETYRYRPGPPLPCPIHALLGEADPTVSRTEAEGWADHTEGGFELTSFPGGHFYLTACQDHVVAVLARYASGAGVVSRAPRPG